MHEEIKIEFTHDADGNLVFLRDGKVVVDTSADLREFDRRLAVATALRQEIERLGDDVLDVDRNAKVDFLTEWLHREIEALHDYAKLMMILREGVAR